VVRALLSLGAALVPAACGIPLWNPPPDTPARSRIALPRRDTVPSADRQGIWEAVLRFYRSGRVTTEADRAARVHARIGVEPRGSTSEPAPVVLVTTRRAMPYDSVPPMPFDTIWLRDVAERHLVAGLCSAVVLTSCPDTILTTYLALEDPLTWGGVVGVGVWESALNPALCKHRDVFVDHQSAYLKLSDDSGEWKVMSYTLGLRATGSCSLVRKSRR
jgi:hypothetical protein